MIAILRGFVKSIPTLILSLFLAVAVWISAVNAVDPVQQRPLARPIPIDRVGQNADLIVVGDTPAQVMVTLSAPQTVWEQIINDRTSVRAWINLANLGPGTHTVPVNVESNAQPVKIINRSPQTVSISLENLVTQDFPVRLVRRGEPAIGFQSGDPALSSETVTISGPASRVARVVEVRVSLDLTQASDTISRALDVQALDKSGAVVEGITITPAQVQVNQPVTQRGGYRNVVVKVVSSASGQVASGYRLTNISVFPPTVTVFSSNPALVDRLPGFVETSPLDLTGVRDDIDVRLPLNLPNGVEVVGEQTVLVQVSVAAIEGSLTLSALPVQVDNLPENLAARISPTTVDVIISGPVPLLDRLNEADVRVYLELGDVEPGTYQFAPKVTLNVTDLKLESILPSSIEVVVDPRSRVTATFTPTPTPTPTRPVLTPLATFTFTPSP
jgi:YbbR domain-containing protein